MKNQNKKAQDESVEILYENDFIRVEYVKMTSKVSPEGFWYDVPEDEWAFLISGYIVFEYRSTGEIIRYKNGTSFTIPSHTVHRLLGTAQDCAVLCVFSK